MCFVGQLAQARVIVVLSGSTSRPGETLSPKRDREGRFVVLRVSSPRRGTFILCERESRPSEHELIRRLQWFWRLAQIEGLAIRGVI